MAEITGGELLLRCLHAEGVRYINAITDGTYMMVIEAIERLGDELGIKLIVPRHEAAAAHACDAYTRVTGDPAVVMACAGPGAANLVAGMMCAQAEGSPVVAITTTRRSEISDSYVHQGGMQVSRHLDTFRPAVKWNGKVDHWARIPDMVRHAFRVAVSGRPGPVHILIPENILGERRDEESVQIWNPEKYRVVDPANFDPGSIQRAAELLTQADLVNIHCGNGAERAGAGDDPHPARLVNVARHDANFALPGSNDTRTVGADQIDITAFQRGFDFQHIQHRNAFRNAHHNLDAGIRRFQNGVCSKGCRNGDHGGFGAGLRHSIMHGIKDRQAKMRLATLAGSDAADHVGAVGNRLLGVESTLLAGKALADDFGVFIDQYAHSGSLFILVQFSSRSEDRSHGKPQYQIVGAVF